MHGLLLYVFHYFVAAGWFRLLEDHGAPLGALVLVGVVGSFLFRRRRRRRRL